MDWFDGTAQGRGQGTEAADAAVSASARPGQAGSCPGGGPPAADAADFHLHAVLRLALAAAAHAGPAGFGPAALGLAAQTDVQLATRAAQLESLARHLGALQLQYAGELAARTRAGRYRATGAANPIAMLAETLQISGREAAHRISLAGDLLPVLDPISARTIPARLPALAEAVLSGRCSQEAALVVSSYTAQASHLADGGRITLHDVRKVETALTALAVAERPELLRECAHRTINLLDPDGQQPTEAELLAKEGIRFARPRRGLVSFTGHLTVPDYEELMAAIGTGTNPRQTRGTSPAGGTADGMTSDAARTGDPSLFDSLESPAGSMPDWARDPEAGGTAGATPRGEGHAAAAPGAADSHADFAGAGKEPSVGNGQTTGAGSAAPEGSDGTNPDGPGNTRAAGDSCTAGDLDLDECGGDQAVKDRRPRPQALLHTLLDCVKLASRTDTLPDNGGLRPQLFITMTLAELTAGLGNALLPHAGSTSIASIRQAACDADIIPAVLGAAGEILDVGRSQRLVPPPLRKALVIRDHGCAFPGCTLPLQWTEAHHIVPWIEGGETSLANCVLLCSFHHHLLHHTDWAATMVKGRPWFIPPMALDIFQRPRRNHVHDPSPIRITPHPPD
ncbi:DUF222 domain-containing protein [Pseudarthrobacter sp. P1]|uniref:HNH endonuclease signature motif containing protein n=1 Tax=Pseudarthrobacter sp. P1 TaxID=3418418 RepID=UPI003CF3CE12